jgi:non-ribosomal peptide synthetase component F
LYNLYGPTEAAIDVTAWRCLEEKKEGERRRRIAIGRPIGNTQMYVLDERQEPVGVGVMGELYIGGEAVGRGYWGKAAMTAERFVPDGVSGKSGERLYRTGDVGRYRGDGGIEYVGRKDEQVKLRGMRVELGEIEAVLGRHEEVREAAVVVKERGNGEKWLVGYVVKRGGQGEEEGVGGGELRSWLRGKLPEHMIPGRVVMLKELPLNPNGKLDRKAMSSLHEEWTDNRITAPETKLEEKILAIWKEVLGITNIGIDDNFFDAGGHSLLMARVHFRLQNTLQQFPLVDTFQYPTVRLLAQHLAKNVGLAATGTARTEEDLKAGQIRLRNKRARRQEARKLIAATTTD